MATAEDWPSRFIAVSTPCRDSETHPTEGLGDRPVFRFPEVTDYEMSAQAFGRHPAPTVCETGFNVGHSAITFMSALRNATYYGFDLGQLGQRTRIAASLLNDSFFPRRVHLVLGKSARTLPKFVKSHTWLKCDVISIDGDHTDDGMASDWEALRHLAHPQSLIFTDDIRNMQPNGGLRFASGLGTPRAVHALFRDHAELDILGCTRLPMAGDTWADEGWLAYRKAPLPTHLVGHPERRHRRRPGGFHNVTGKPLRPLPASTGLCVARMRGVASGTSDSRR